MPGRPSAPCGRKPTTPSWAHSRTCRTGRPSRRSSVLIHVLRKCCRPCLRWCARPDLRRPESRWSVTRREGDMTAPTLRPYQHLARLDVSRVWRSGGRGALLVLPTGAGKTVTAYSIVDREIAEGRRVLWLAHVDVLLGQSVRTAARFGHADAGVVKAGRTSPEAVLQIGSMQTLGRRLEAAARRFTPDLIVVDEAHRAVCATYVRILAAWPAARILGCTATPWRGDGRGLGEAFGAIVCPTTPQRLVDQGHLVPPLMRRLQWQPDLAGVHRRAGEYATAGAEKVC